MKCWRQICRIGCVCVLALAGCRAPRVGAPDDSLRYAGYSPLSDSPRQAAGTEGIPVDGEDGEAFRDRPLRSGDPVTVFLRGPETTELHDVIDENGMINLPNIGRVRIGGSTTTLAADAIEQAYIDAGIYLRLTVIVISRVQQRQDSFFVYGEARGQGRYEYTESMTLLQAISTAGGLTDYANPSRVFIRRGGRMTRYDIRPMLRGDAPDVLLRAGDVITIKARWW